MTTAVPRTTEELIMDVLRAADEPMTVAAIITAVGARSGVRVFRADADAALHRLIPTSMAANLDDPGYPRRWIAIPGA